MAPLYAAAALVGYASVRWLGAFSDEQCAGINHFVALYAAPLLVFHMVSTNNSARFVACGHKIALLSMVLRFLIGPVAMLLAVGLHGTLMHVAVVQAAPPLSLTTFVYAEEYKVHADIMSTALILGTFISLPVTIVYYILLGL